MHGPIFWSKRHARPPPHSLTKESSTPSALMLDPRLTPLDRNGWQVLNMLKGADGLTTRGERRSAVAGKQGCRGNKGPGPATAAARLGCRVGIDGSLHRSSPVWCWAASAL